MSDGRRTAKEEGHSGTGVDFDSGGTRHTIPAAAAEFADKLPAFLFDEGLAFVGEGRRIVVVGEEFVELMFVLDAPDRNDGVFGEVGVCGIGTGDEAAGKCFHADEADVAFFAETDEVFLFFTGEVREGELEGVV